MIDRLLGRAGLKERIEELEEEKRHLERRAEAEEQRRSDAVADRQRAEERVNELEHRIESLEERLDRTEGAEESVEFRRQRSSRSTTGRCTRAFPRRRERRPRRASHRLRSGRRRGTVERRGVVRRPTRLVRRAAPAVVIADDTGAVSAALTPRSSRHRSTGGATGSDSTSRGSARPDDSPSRSSGRTPSRSVFTRATSGSRSRGSPDVKEAHSKGGFSQGRFERRREGQIDEHLKKATAALADPTPMPRSIGRSSSVSEACWARSESTPTSPMSPTRPGSRETRSTTRSMTSG